MAFGKRRGTSGEGQHNSNFSHQGKLPMRAATERGTRMTEVSAGDGPNQDRDVNGLLGQKSVTPWNGGV